MRKLHIEPAKAMKWEIISGTKSKEASSICRGEAISGIDDASGPDGWTILQFIK